LRTWRVLPGINSGTAEEPLKQRPRRIGSGRPV
jgi:hypothetical protein